ncbi:MAG: hypothetical protein QOE35_2261 [Actinomycetota bacterium]|jgi:hypothetical protein
MTPLDADSERNMAAALFNHVWTLLDSANRSAADDAEMIHAAHASCFHWLQSGAPVNAARGEWQCSRVYAVLGRAEPALFHAHRCLAICEEHDIGDWDIAFAYEALARGCAVAGDHDQAGRFLELARTATAAIAEDDDRAAVQADLDTVPRP